MLDAALNAPGGLLWVFKGPSYWAMDLASGALRRGPLPLSEWAADHGGLPGGFAHGIDAACWAGESFPKSYYLFKGDAFVKLEHPAFDPAQAPAQAADGSFERALTVTEFFLTSGGWCCDGQDCWLTSAPTAAAHGLGFERRGSLHFFDGPYSLRHNLLDGSLLGPPRATHFDVWGFPRHGGSIDLAFYDTGFDASKLVLVSGTQCARYDVLTDSLGGAQPLDQAFPTLWQLSGMAGQFLVIRRQDMAVIGVHWHGMSLRGGAELEATSADARLVITLPPQSVGEQVMGGGAVHLRGITLAAPSQLALGVARGRRVGLSVQALLGLVERARVMSPPLAKWQTHTMLDVPCGLLWSPRAADGGSVVCAPARPAPGSAAAAWPLWQLELRAHEASTDDDAGLQMQPAIVRTDGDPPQGVGEPLPALPLAHRQMIFQRAAQGVLPSVRHLRLATPGASLRATGSWPDPDLHWDHDMLVGRDQAVRVISRGRLYPFGHRATLFDVTTRTLQAPPPPPVPVPPPPFTPPPSPSPAPAPGPHPPFMEGASPLDADVLRELSFPFASAGLQTERVLVIDEPELAAVRASGAAARAFPFDAVNLEGRCFDRIEALRDDRLIRNVANNTPRPFAMQWTHPDGALSLQLPLCFVADGEHFDANALAQKWAPAAAVALPGVVIDLLRLPTPGDSDRIELHALQFASKVEPDQWLPKIASFDAVVPALRAMDLSGPVRLLFHDDYLAIGDARVPWRFAGEVIVDFADKAARSGGMVVPHFKPDVVSRELGPVVEQAIGGLTEEALKAFKETRLLGMSLESLISHAGDEAAPRLVPVLREGTITGATLTWDVGLHDVGPLKTHKTRLKLLSTIDERGSEVHCTLNDIGYELGELLRIDFPLIEFLQLPGQQPELKLSTPKLDFKGELKLFKGLMDKATALLGVPGLRIRATPEVVTASYDLPIPEASCGSFTLRNVAMRLAVEIPLRDRPVTASVGFGSRELPFSLTVLGLGGGGHIMVSFGGSGLAGFEASIEFGAMVALNLGVVRAEVHAFGGIRFELPDLRLVAYIRIGGCVSLLGLITVTVELLVQLIYDEPSNRLSGNASIVVEVDLTFYSDSFRLDSGTWTLIGGSDPRRKALLAHADPGYGESQWRQYQESFA